MSETYCRTIKIYIPLMNMKYEELLLNLKIRPQDQLFGHVGILFGLVVIHFIKGLGRSTSYQGWFINKFSSWVR